MENDLTWTVRYWARHALAWWILLRTRRLIRRLIKAGMLVQDGGESRT